MESTVVNAYIKRGWDLVDVIAVNVLNKLVIVDNNHIILNCI